MYSTKHQPVIKTVLENGLTLLVYPMHAMPKVSAQMWYHVGSKDEKSGEKGLAHFLEHMLFKGAGYLTESDINVLTHKLSGYCNAFTSHDTTMYLFDMPAQHWYEILPVFVECMSNATLDEDHLNSEVKAVVQELKMYKDDFGGYIFEELISTIFLEHPYHYPIIGYKQDLWELNRTSLYDFYKKHYVPNNATLVIVGDIHPDDVIARVTEAFSSIPGSPDYKKQQHYWQEDIVAKSITMQRDVENPIFFCSWVIPGLNAGDEYTTSMANWLLAQGKGSRLYKTVVDELQIALDVQTFLHNFFDYGLFSLEFQLKDVSDVAQIKAVVAQEIEKLLLGWTEKEQARAQKKIEIDYVTLFESSQKLGMAIGETYLATGDVQYVPNFLNQVPGDNQDLVKDFLRRYLRPSVMHTALLTPITEQEQLQLDVLQEESDLIDAELVAHKERITPLQQASYATTIYAQKPITFNFPNPQKFLLHNGLHVIYHSDTSLPITEIILDLKAKHHYEPEHLQGISICLNQMMIEGTKTYPGHLFALELESCGISVQVDPGSISMTMLKADLKKGLEFLRELLTNAQLEASCIGKIKERMLADIHSYWEEPSEFVNHIIRQKLYGNHPYTKHILGTAESVAQITHKDVVDWYHTSCVPQDATLVVVGDLEGYNIYQEIEEVLGDWHGSALKTIQFPALHKTDSAGKMFTHHIKRDQTVVCFAGLSVARMDNDFDKLIVFDQIFSGGVLNSMNSRLFMLRELTGLFYTIRGSLCAGSDEQPGMVLVKTIVSNDSLEEAIEKIKYTIDTAIDTVTQEEFEQAKNILANAMIDNFATYQSVAASLLFLKRYNLPDDYFATRAQVFNAISFDDMVKTVKNYVQSDRLLCIKVGRV